MPAFIDALTRSFEALGPWAYLFIALFAMGESVIFVAYFLPGASVMAFIGFLCSLNVYSFWGMVLASFVGHVAGENLNYILGERNGRWLFRPGHRHFRPETLNKLERRFNRGALRLLLVGQFIGMLRPLVSFTAGVVKYPFRRFCIVIAVLSVAWSLAHLGIGFVLGESWKHAGFYMNVVGLALIALFALVFVSHWLLRGMHWRARFRRLMLNRHPYFRPQ